MSPILATSGRTGGSRCEAVREGAWARSRWFPASSSRTLIAQTCLGLGCRFWPTIRPLFQAERSARMAANTSDAKEFLQKHGIKEGYGKIEWLFYRATRTNFSIT